MSARRLIFSGWVAVSLAALWAFPGPVNAQDSAFPEFIEVDPISRVELGIEPWNVREAMARVRSQFLLFGEGDRAWTSLRMVGDNRIYETNSGPGDDFGLFTTPIVQFSTPSGTFFQTFGIPLMMSAPRSEWVRYLVEGVESLRNARGGGFTAMWNGEVFARPKDFNAADGLVGTLLSGVTSTVDGSCLDHSASLGGALLPAGFQLLPGSNCPPTLSPAGGWLGDRPIAPDTWVGLFKERGSSFRFDRWRVARELKDQGKFLGNNFATYGHFNDYNITTLRKFGNVVPGGAGDASRSGWPLGIDFVFDAFTFTLPTVANAKFWTALIINNSERLYGVPHDYDSLYIGLGPWPGRRQDGDNYMIPELGAWVSSESSGRNSPECQRVKPIPLLSNTCGGFDGGRPNGFTAGAHGIIVLKSPIGDLRNKLFTRAGSPFFRLDHPLAGDTITFNHSVNWNFGPWGAVWNQGTDRQRFGVMSSTSENVLDGRACSEMASTFTRWHLFNSPTWPENQCDFKFFVPGVTGGAKTWTYTTGRPRSKPLAPDTLHLATCGPPGCPVPWADSTWQGFSANSFGNLSQFSLGPFRLAAGDTTELMIAMYSGRDSVPFESFTQAIVDFYLGLFAGPEAPPPVAIRELDIGTGVTPAGRTPDLRASVRLVWDDAPEQWVDPFVTKFAQDMQDAGPGTELALIRDANPGLVDRIRARAQDNLARLLVFKSCDGGSTFDANNDCVGDPAVDESGNSIEPGWQAFRVFEPDATGDFPNTLTDGSVTPGVRYLYTILGQSKGFKETVISDPNARREVTTGGQTVFTCGLNPCETKELEVAPALLNPLSRSAADPNVVSVYVPASGAAGGRIASVEFVNRDAEGKSTVPFSVLLVSSDLRENTFQTWFGNRIQIVEQRNATTDALVSVDVTVEDAARTVVGETGPTTQIQALASQTFRRTDGLPVTINAASLTSDVTAGGVRTKTFTIGPGNLDPDKRFAVGFVLTEGGVPLLASGKLEGDAATPGGFLAHPAFPGFMVSADNRGAGVFQESFWTGAGGDTLSAELDPTLELDRAASVNTGVQGLTFGEYVIEFADSVFGPGSPFRLNFANPAQTDADFDASLLARRAGTTGVTDDEAVALVAARLGKPASQVTLGPVKFPFTVRNLTHNRTAELAMVARDTIFKVLGLAPDTLSVTVDPDLWIPLDPVFVIETVDLLATRTVGGQKAIVVNPDGTPVRAPTRTVTFGPMVFTCGGANPSCNAVRGVGFGQWIGENPGDAFHAKFFSPFVNASRFEFRPQRSIQGREILTAGGSIREQMEAIRVVPNPYIFFSAYEVAGEQRRIMFTNLPPDGEIRIYTVSGQFVQEIDYGPDDLAGNGDLFWDLSSREGNDVLSGLYIFIVKARDPGTGEEVKKTGKFVIIR